MTDSDIYQLIGKAYCDGLTQGLHKAASMEKSALSATTLQEILKKVKSLGNSNKTLQTANRINSRARGVVNALDRIGEAGVSDGLKLYNYQRPWAKLLKDTSELSSMTNNSSLKTLLETSNAMPGHLGASRAYTRSAINGLFDTPKLAL